ncbi:SH3 domain-containing protein [Azospirillum sp. YIM B02556]|uniref:SH3 domain-containing protein n=1 Tax=Azospirillum endophyticum TaxID=2800326 RepID=A0ABS1F5G8_9PROT|nr:SH3 domain-containing protein [Azospirillum endophyticum]MBK1838671.1 SH3 domain-containing protein [Azospirillum endophyticum]
MSRKTIKVLVAAVGLAATPAIPALAASGDIQAVVGEKVNLRAGPSDDAAVRSTIARGEEVVELRREGSWLGVRVLRTGEEGWLFSDLVKRQTASTLGGGDTAPAQAGFSRLSPGFDGLVASISDTLGYRFADKVEQGANGSLRVVPTQEWLYNTGRDAKMFAALSLYQMWKNYNNGKPVTVTLGAQGPAAITIADAAKGPEITGPTLGSAR